MGWSVYMYANWRCARMSSPQLPLVAWNVLSCSHRETDLGLKYFYWLNYYLAFRKKLLENIALKVCWCLHQDTSKGKSAQGWMFPPLPRTTLAWYKQKLLRKLGLFWFLNWEKYQIRQYIVFQGVATRNFVFLMLLQIFLHNQISIQYFQSVVTVSVNFPCVR